MNLQKNKIQLWGKKSFAFLIVVLIFLSFCPLKRSLKAWVGAPVNTAQNVVHHHSSNTFQGQKSCGQSDNIEVGIASQNISGLDQQLPAGVFLLTLLPFILNGVSFSKAKSRQQVHPIQSFRIPIYLRLRKLILYDSAK